MRGWILLAAGLTLPALAQDDPRIARWQSVDAERVLADSGEEVLWVPWGDGSTISLSCPEGSAPDVSALTRGVRVHADLVAPGAERGTWQIVPPASARWSGFVVRPSSCDVERRRTAASPWAWALAEHEGRIDADREALTGEAAASWAGIDDLRRAALRPPGPHPVGSRRLWTDRRPIELAGRDWSRVSADEDVVLRGPVRLRIDARALGDGAPETCILLDGGLLCQPSTPSRTTLPVEGFLRYDLRTLEDGTPVHGARPWQIALGPGEHRLRMDRDALVRASVHRVETYGQARPRRQDLEASEGIAVWTPPEPPEWSTAPMEGGDPRWFGRDGRPGSHTLYAWHDVERMPRDFVPMERGEIALWIEGEGEGGTYPGDDTCVVQIGEHRWAAKAPLGVHRFEWVGPLETPRVRPRAVGCRAWLHGSGPIVEDAVKSLVYLHVVGEGEATWFDTRPGVPARVEVSLPAGTQGAVVRAITRSGLEVVHTLDATPDAPGRLDEEGQPFTDPVRLPLPILPMDDGEERPGWWITIDANEAAVRVQQPATDSQAAPRSRPPGATWEKVALEAPLSGHVGELGQAVFEGVPPSRDAVRRASRAVAEAEDDRVRAGLLVARGGLLAARGEEALAAYDLLRAEERDALQPGLDGPVGRALRLARERSLYGADRWRAEGSAWVALAGDEVSEVERARLEAAAAGDFLAVATSMDGVEAVRWWRRALLGGQIPTPEQRLQAFLLASRLDPHPGLQLLRTGTSWDGVNLVRGAGRRRPVPWPISSSSDDALLYPDAWPPERVVSLRRGWLLRMPPRGSDQRIPVRCQLGILGTRGPCRLLVEDAFGNIQSIHQLSSWGEISELPLPAGGTAYVRLDEPRGAHVELLWEERFGVAPGVERLAYEARAGVPLTAQILGPTALRTHVRPLVEGPVKVTVRAGNSVVTQIIEGEGEVVSEVPVERGVTVSVVMDRPAWVRLSTRRPTRGGAVPLADRATVLTAVQVSEVPERSERAVPPLPAPRHALASGRPARTFIAGLSVGSSEWVPAESRGPNAPPPGVTVLGGIQSRVSDATWTEADLTVQGRTDGTVLGQLHGGGDVRLTRGRTRVFAIGDLDLATGPFAGAALGSARGDLGLRLVHPVWPGGTFQGRLRVRGATRTALDPELFFPVGRSMLWSRYLEDHRLTAAASATLRHRFGPWVVARGGLGIGTNAPNDAQPIDGVSAFGSVDLTRPAWFTRLGAGLDLRLPDAHRKDVFPSVVFDARTTLYPWLSVRNGLHPWAGARWRPVDRKASVMVGIEGRFGPPRGLDDVRPSRLTARHVGEWGFWEQARARWPVGETSEMDPDWTPPGPEPVEVAP